jgi:uncharacterized membrane protein (DUF106 family)
MKLWNCDVFGLNSSWNCSSRSVLFLKYILLGNISVFFYLLKFICDTNILKRSKNNKKNQISWKCYHAAIPGMCLVLWCRIFYFFCVFQMCVCIKKILTRQNHRKTLKKTSILYFFKENILLKTSKK